MLLLKNTSPTAAHSTVVAPSSSEPENIDVTVEGTSRLVSGTFQSLDSGTASTSVRTTTSASTTTTATAAGEDYFALFVSHTLSPRECVKGRDWAQYFRVVHILLFQ